MDSKKSKIAARMHDYQRFAIILLCVGSFFYLGTILPAEGKTEYSTAGYLLASVVFLVVSILCFLQATKYKKNLVDKDE